jgi:hypothetical protein
MYLKAGVPINAVPLMLTGMNALEAAADVLGTSLLRSARDGFTRPAGLQLVYPMVA